MKIAFCAPGDDIARWQAALRRHLAGVELLPWTEGMQRIEARYALIWSPQAEFFDALDGAKAVFNLGAGVDALLRLPDLPARMRGVPIIRIEDAGMGAMMAEYVVHAIARHTRHFGRFEMQQGEARWVKHRPQARSAWPVGVMGLGEMGGRIARVLAALDYPVSGWSRTPRVIEGVRCHAGETGLAAFLAVSRILVNALPLTPHTRGLLDAKAFAQLPPGALLVNVGRGATVDEAALLDALDRGNPDAAVLDVFPTEPLPADHPFWRHPKITLTPHISAPTLVEDSAAQIAAKIEALERGERVGGVVDFSRGY